MNRKLGLIVAVLLLVLAAYQGQLFDNYWNDIYDTFYQKPQEVDDDIVIIAIDDVTINTLGQWPFDRSVHAELIDFISQGNPAAIGVDLMFDSYSNETSDSALAASVQSAGNVVMAKQIVYSPKINGYKQGSDALVMPFPELVGVSTQGHINTYADSDRVIRKINLFGRRFDIESQSYDYEPNFAYAICEQYLKHGEMDESKRQALTQTLQKYSGDSDNLYIDYKGIPRSYDNIPYIFVYNEAIPASYFEDKIVLIGPYANGMQDEYITPVVKEQPMFGVEIHANIIQNLLEDSFKRPVHSGITILTIVVMGVLAYLFSSRLSPAKGLVANLIVLGVYLALAHFTYQKGYILRIFYPIIAMLVMYVSTLAYHYLEQLSEKKRIKSLFGRYVAPQVVEKILSDGDNIKLGGERRFISVLFVDIRGFTPLSEKAEPEQIVEILNNYLELCEQSIFKNGGTLDKFIGDATMAIYNAPLDLEAHALQAVKTAWDMKMGAQKLKEDLYERFGKTVDFGIGINTGHAVVGNIGSKQRMDYTAIGDTVNTSARLESNAKAGQILISESTYEQVKDKISAVPLGEIKVKGKETMIKIYQVEGVESDEDKGHQN